MAEKYAIDGAKVKCTMCSKPEGKLMVTSNTISIQDKFWATEDDKGKPNVIFQGNCLKFSNNPPPCQSVMALSQWKKTAIGVTIDNKAPLLENSLIMCTTGGVPVTIVDTKQKSIPTNLASLAKEGTPVPAVVITNDPEIIDAYWVDKDEEKTTVIDYGEKVRVRIKTNNAIDKKITINIFESDPGLDDPINSYVWNITSKDMIYSFNLTPELFSNGGDAVAKLYFSLKIEGKAKRIFSDSNDKYLLVDIIRYIPNIMRAQDSSWEAGAKLMEKWFKGKSFALKGKAEDSHDYLNLPYDDSIITLDWVKKYKRGLASYNKISNKQNKLWVTNNAKKIIVKYLKNDKILSYNNECISFNFIKENAHKSNEYTSQYVAIRQGDLSNLDGFIAALANSELRLSVNGYVTPTYNIMHIGWKVTITEVAIYLRDSYDFTDDSKKWFSQPLGIWNPSSNFVSGKKADITEGYFVNNSDFRKWRNRHKKGGDFLVFSKMETFEVFDEFSINLKFKEIK